MISATLSAGGAQSTRIGIASTVIGVDSPSAPNGGSARGYQGVGGPLSSPGTAY